MGLASQAIRVGNGSVRLIGRSQESKRRFSWMERSTRTKIVIEAGRLRWRFPGKEWNFLPKRMADQCRQKMGMNGGSISHVSINTRRHLQRKIRAAGR